MKLWWILPYTDMNQPQVYMVPYPERSSHLPPHPIPLGCPSALALSPVSCIERGPVIYFTDGNIHVLMLFSQIIQSKSLFFTSVSLVLSCI